ncbi:MAG: hypothetical protein ABI559_09645 [Chloroflexota bacterium]
MTITGDNVFVSGLVITSAADDGLYVSGENFTLTHSYIGVGSDGTSPLPNQGFGVQIIQAANATIGGGRAAAEICSDQCNLISGAINDKANVFLDVGSSNASVVGNFIGTDVTGTTAIAGNNGQGVADKGTNNSIGGILGIGSPGGPCQGDCNLISGNNLTSVFTTYGSGVLIAADAVGTKVRGNFIGTDVTGTQAIGNGPSGRGVLSSSPTAVIGGTMGRNVISGNALYNVDIEGLAGQGVLQANYIGTNSAGTEAFASNGTGVFIGDANGATIGGSNPGEGNLVSGAGTNLPGISIYRSTNITVQGNLIGTEADGVSPLPNGGGGVILHNESSNNIIGGFAASAGNTIAYNENGAGVYVNGLSPPVRSNTIRYNSIHDNAGKGIALTGSGNDALAPPAITGTNPLTGTACGECTVDIYSDDANEGLFHDGSVFTDITGNWTFPGSLTGPNVTATNTDNSNNTSEFSQPFTVATPTPTPSPSPSPAPTSTQSSTPTPTNTPQAGLIQGDVDCSGIVDLQDFVRLIEFAAGVSDGVNSGDCPDIGGAIPAGATPDRWGDVNCDGTVDALDALAVLAWPDFELPHPGCEDIGHELT